MARLSADQAIKVLKTPKNSTFIASARKQEQRLVLHTEPIPDKEALPSGAFQDLCNWVKSFLSAEKYARWLQMLITPVDTVESCKAIFDELSKIYDAQDSFQKYEFVAPELGDDFLAYTEKLRDADFWKNQAFDALRRAINSFLVIDLPATQNSDRPEPYYFMLSIDNVHDVDIRLNDGSLEYIAFYQGPLKVVIICEEFYRVAEKPETGGEWTFTSEIPHSKYDAAGKVIDGLGYCPATSFYNIAISGSAYINKRGPITDVLGKLDYLLFWRASQRYYHLYGSYPIIVSYEEECTYKDAKGNTCNEGFVNTYVRDPFEEGGEITTQIECPACQMRKMIGPGSVWTVTPPRNKDGFDAMENPVKMISAGTDLLEWGSGNTDALEMEIYWACVGDDGEKMNKQAVNEDQVSANFESKETILNRINEQMERAKKFCLDTVAILRYGRNYFVKSVVKNGNDYFLKSEAELTDNITKAKGAGLPLYYIDAIVEKLVQTKAKNNPDQQQRFVILQNLEPYPHLTIAQMQAMRLDELDPQGYVVKLNFPTFIMQFEREQTNIVEFASLQNFNIKIKLISETLISYGQGQITKASKPRPDTSGNGGPA